MSFLLFLQRLFLVYQWQDIFEISVLSIVFYKIILFLAHDTDKPLLRYFYLYFFLILMSYSYHCATLQILLLVTAPAIFTFFIILHQETLQKNFVALYRPAIKRKKELWHYGLIQLCQKLATNNQSTAFIIEKKQNLELLVTIPIACNTPFSYEFFSFFYANPLIFSEKFVLLTYEGIARGINVSINEHPILHTLNTREEKELYLTAKTDALLLKMDATTLTFTCIHNNKKLTHLSAHSMTLILDIFFENKTYALQGAEYESLFSTTYKKT